MSATRLLLCLACAFFAVDAHAASPPEQYRDDAVVVRAGIPEAGTVPLHLGKVLTLVVQVDFDPRAVQVEALDEVFFQTAFADLEAFRLMEPPAVASEKLGDGRMRIDARWRFQVLDCPVGRQTCPGTKRYELPTLSLSYRLIGAAGDTASTRAARFHPRPDRLVLAPALGALQPDATLTDYFPGGAWPPPAGLAHAGWTAPATAIAGGLLLAAGLGAGWRRRDPAGRGREALGTPHRSRWEELYASLRDEASPDERWADRLRRCIAWYCQEELAVNPCRWLAHHDSPGGGIPAGNAEWRDLWLDVLQLERVPPRQRADLLARMARLAGLPPAART